LKPSTSAVVVNIDVSGLLVNVLQPSPGSYYTRRSRSGSRRFA
jgi:hypothetical protein